MLQGQLCLGSGLLSPWLQVCAFQVSALDVQGRESQPWCLGRESREAGARLLDSPQVLQCPIMPLDWGLGILGTPGQVSQSKSSRRYQLKMNESTSASGTQKHAYIQEAG